MTYSRYAYIGGVVWNARVYSQYGINYLKSVQKADGGFADDADLNGVSEPIDARAGV